MSTLVLHTESDFTVLKKGDKPTIKFENLISAVISITKMNLSVKSYNLIKAIVQTMDKDKNKNVQSGP